MPDRPLVSVVIPTRDRHQLVTRAITSVRSQTYAPIEIIVVDDGSADGTAKDLENQEDVRLIRLPESRGGAAARNRGIAEARGEFVAFLDSDDQWLPNKLERQIPILEADPRVGAVYCRHFTHDDETGVRQETYASLYTGNITDELLAGRCPRTVSLFVVRKFALDEVGGFDEGLRGFQDTDLWIRIASSWHFDAVDEALAVVHNHPAPRITTDIAAREAALERFLAKWGDAMRQRLGDSGVANYQRNQLAVAQGAVVLSVLRTRGRWAASKALARYIGVAGLSNPRQLTGLFVAWIAGTDSRIRLKRLRQQRGQ